MSTLPPPVERINLCTTPEIKELIVHAASAAGVSLSAYLIASAQDRAKQLLAERETLTFSPRDWNAFFTALDNTDQPRPQLEAAAQDYLTWRAQNAAAMQAGHDSV